MYEKERERVELICIGRRRAWHMRREVGRGRREVGRRVVVEERRWEEMMTNKAMKVMPCHAFSRHHATARCFALPSVPLLPSLLLPSPSSSPSLPVPGHNTSHLLFSSLMSHARGMYSAVVQEHASRARSIEL